MHLPTLAVLLLMVQETPGSMPPATAASCVACQVDLQGMRSGYSNEDWQALTHGDIVTSDTEEPQSGGSIQSRVESSAIISYPPGMVWSVVTDLEARPKYVPGLKQVRIIRTDGNRVWAAQLLRFFLINIRYQLVDTFDPERGVAAWALDKSVPHDIADTTGSWQIAPLPPGETTLVRYRAWVDTGRPVPRFIADFLTKRSLPKIVAGLRAEVQRRSEH